LVLFALDNDSLSDLNPDVKKNSHERFWQQNRYDAAEKTNVLDSARVCSCSNLIDFPPD